MVSQLGLERLGRLFGTHVFTPTQAVAGKAAKFYVAGSVGILGVIIYCFLPEGNAVDLRVMDEEFEQYMRDEGYIDKMDEDSS
jgi:hypothetical protein